jgi:hypothetical protein
LSRSLLGNTHSNANTFATPRQASRNSTTDHHGTTQANNPDPSQPATLHTPARLPEAPPTCTDKTIGMRKAHAAVWRMLELGESGRAVVEATGLTPAQVGAAPPACSAATR